MTFWTRTATPSGATVYPDRLQVRLSTSGTSAEAGNSSESVGVFDTLLLDINPTLSATGYPFVWTEFTVTVPPTAPDSFVGRLSWRYYVFDGGPQGHNSKSRLGCCTAFLSSHPSQLSGNYIGIDEVTVSDAAQQQTFVGNE
jgi:hypothetical protein